MSWMEGERRCEICGGRIKGAGKKYCSYCKNSREAKEIKEENYAEGCRDRTNLGLDYKKNPKYLLPFVAISIVALVVLGMILSSNHSDTHGSNLPLSKPLMDEPCQYKELKETGNYTQVYYTSNGTEFKDAVSVVNIKAGAGKDSPTSFEVVNKIPYKTRVNISYYTSWQNAFDSGLDNTEREIEMKPLETVIVRETHPNGDTNLKNFQIKLFPTSDLQVKLEKTKEEICKLCNNTNCINDNEKCSLNSQCGSGTCNVLNLCGKERVVDCPKGTKNCNNQSCLPVNLKKVGEKYSCEFECKTGYGENGVCKRSAKQIFAKSLFVIIFIILVYFIIYVIFSEKSLS